MAFCTRFTLRKSNNVPLLSDLIYIKFGIHQRNTEAFSAYCSRINLDIRTYRLAEILADSNTDRKIDR